MTDERTLTGTVVSVSADTLVVEAWPSRTALQKTNIAFERLEVEALERRVRRSSGRGSNRGMLIGAGVSSAVVLVSAVVADRTTGPEDLAGLSTLIIGGLVVVPVATALGAGIGALAPGGWWVPVSGYPVTVGPGGAGLSVRMSF